MVTFENSLCDHYFARDGSVGVKNVYQANISRLYYSEIDCIYRVNTECIEVTAAYAPSPIPITGHIQCSFLPNPTP